VLEDTDGGGLVKSDVADGGRGGQVLSGAGGCGCVGLGRRHSWTPLRSTLEGCGE
jgi:hypothetical protein